jgi:PHD/YefM family antitoxin component YafN of YafNO toxin-antitoxin module
MPNIKSSTDLRNSYNAISTFCHENREPVFITKNGQGDLAVMSIEVYEEIIRKRNVNFEASQEELYRLLDEGRADVLTGRTRLHTEVMADMRRRINDSDL